MQRFTWFAIVIMFAVRTVVAADGIAAKAADATGTAAASANSAPAAVISPRFILAPAVGTLAVSGNIRRFEQYVIPPKGIYLGEVTLHYLAPDGHSLLDVALVNPGERTEKGDLWWGVQNGLLVLRASDHRTEFYRDWTPTDPTASFRRDKADLAYRAGTSEMMVSASETRFKAPFGDDPEDWQRTTAGVGYATNAHGWLASAALQQENLSFSQGDNYSGHSDTVGVRVSPLNTARTSLEANAFLTQTSLDGAAISPRRFGATLDGAQTLTANWSLLGEFSHGEIPETITLNAYARRETNADLSAEYQGLRNTTLDFGGGVRNVNYVNTLQTAATDAQENSLFAKVTTRLSKKLKVNGAVEHGWTDNRPVALELTGVPIGALVWSSRDEARLEANYALSWRSGLTARWRELNWRNTDFSSGNSLTEDELFAWWMPTDKLTGYLTVLKQDFSLSGIPASGLFLTNSDAVVTGLTYQLTTPLTLDASVTNAVGSGAEDSNEHLYSLGANYNLPKGSRLSIRMVRDLFHTAVSAPTLNYRANWYELRFTKAIF